MALTLRATKGSRLTTAEMDANLSGLADLSLTIFTQSGSGATSETAQDILRSLAVTPQMYGAVADGTTDDTAAINKAIVYATSSGKAVFLPAATYLVTSSLTTIAGQFTMFGEGPFKSRLKFAPTANDTLIELSNGASRVEHVVLRDFDMYSTDTTYTKIALDVYDLSQCVFERLFIHGTGMASGPGAGAGWSDGGATSIGIRTHGREATGVKNLSIFADRPIVVAANPNVAATDGEDMDHWTWENLYLIANGNYLIEVDAGLGLMETGFAGYQAWVGGTGGFKINDTRVAPNVESRGITFKNVRHEQITDAAGYSFNMVFTQPVQQIKLENVLIASGGHGITINGFIRMVLDQLTTGVAAGKNSIVTAGLTSSSVLVMRGCYWQTGTNVTLTGLTQIIASAYRSASFAGPSDAVYAGQITDTLVNVGKVTSTIANGTVGLTVVGTTGDRISVTPQVAGSGASVRVLNNGSTDFEPLGMTAESYDFRYRTGVGTSASALVIDTSAQTKFTNRIFPAQDTGAAQSVCGLYAGTGVPNNANGTNGDFYLRSDGTQAGNTVIYHREGGAWVALVTT